MFRVPPFFRLLLSLGIVCASASPALAGEIRTERGHLVRFDASWAEAGREVADLLPGVEDDVRQALDAPRLEVPTEVVVVGGLEAIRKEAGARIPEWAAGVYVGGRNRIVIRADRVVPPRPQQSIRTVLRHEWVHLAWDRMGGEHRRLLPLWFEEGLAEVIGGGVSVGGSARLDVAVVFQEPLDFATIAQRFPLGKGAATLAYAQSRSFVEFFLDQRGWSGMRELLGEMASGAPKARAYSFREPFDGTLLALTQRSLDRWQADWLIAAEEEARPWWHLFGRDLTGTILLLLAVFSVFAAWGFWRRRKRDIAALPDDG